MMLEPSEAQKQYEAHKRALVEKLRPTQDMVARVAEDPVLAAGAWAAGRWWPARWRCCGDDALEVLLLLAPPPQCRGGGEGGGAVRRQGGPVRCRWRQRQAAPLLTPRPAAALHPPAGFEDPEVMAAVNEIAADPSSMRKHQKNPKVCACCRQAGLEHAAVASTRRAPGARASKQAGDAAAAAHQPPCVPVCRSSSSTRPWAR
jgi:hypothetical protein